MVGVAPQVREDPPRRYRGRQVQPRRADQPALDAATAVHVAEGVEPAHHGQELAHAADRRQAARGHALAEPGRRRCDGLLAGRRTRLRFELRLGVMAINICDLPLITDVRYWMNSRRLLLAESISPFDPSETLAAHCGRASDDGFSPIKV